MENNLKGEGITDEEINELGSLIRAAFGEMTDEYLWMLFMYLAPLVMNPKTMRFTGSLQQECFKNVCQLVDNLLTTTVNGQRFIERDSEIKDRVSSHRPVIETPYEH